MGYRRAKERNERLKKLYAETFRSYGPGVWYNEDKGRLIKCSASNTPGYTKFLRNQSNRKIRRNKDVLNYGSYKKTYDYWWALY